MNAQLASGEDRIIRLPEVMQRVGLSRSAIYRAMDRGAFPQSVKLGSKATGWRLSDIDRWVAAPDTAVPS